MPGAARPAALACTEGSLGGAANAGGEGRGTAWGGSGGGAGGSGSCGAAGAAGCAGRKLKCAGGGGRGGGAGSEPALLHEEALLGFAPLLAPLRAGGLALSGGAALLLARFDAHGMAPMPLAG